jgi:hypothetical protein
MSDIQVQVGATPEEVAAILTVVAERQRRPVPIEGDYERWRANRLTALHRSRR